MKRWLSVLLLCWLPMAPLVHGAVEILTFQTPEQEEQYKDLIDELRCLVCQNQTLADSNADLAKDMRQLTYDMISKGASDQEVVDFMVARYGDFVLYKPPLNISTMLLWVGPFVFMIGGLVMLFVIIRRKRAAGVVADAAGDPDHAAELERARKMLAERSKENES